MLWKELIEHYSKKIDSAKYKRAISSYKTVIDEAKKHNSNDVIVPFDIAQMNITQHMKDQILQMLNRSEEKKVTNEDHPEMLKYHLGQLMGIGDEVISKLITAGLKSSDQLKSKPFWDLLPKSTQTFLKTKPEPAAYEEIAIVKPTIDALCPEGAVLYFVGGFRRGKQVTKDIDIMMVSENDVDIGQFITNLKAYLTIHVYSCGISRCSMVIDISSILSAARGKPEPTKFIRVDVFKTNKEDQAGMLLQSTGSKEFNIALRAIAKNKGYKLNDRGLFKRDSGERVPTQNEEDIFKALGFPFIKPEDREPSALKAS